MPSHQQNIEHFQLLETATNRLSELRGNPDARACELMKWEKIKQNARDHLVLSNRGLVVSIAKGYQNFGLDLEDLTAAGTIGLMQAIDQFDFHRGYCLSTYATNPIRSAISRALSRGGALHLHSRGQAGADPRVEEAGGPVVQ